MFEHKENGMDDKLQKKILRQLRGIRFGLSLLAIISLVGFCIVGFLLFKASNLVHDTQEQLRDMESQASSATELKDKVCASGFVTNSTLCAD